MTAPFARPTGSSRSNRKRPRPGSGGAFLLALRADVSRSDRRPRRIARLQRRQHRHRPLPPRPEDHAEAKLIDTWPKPSAVPEQTTRAAAARIDSSATIVVDLLAKNPLHPLHAIRFQSVVRRICNACAPRFRTDQPHTIAKASISTMNSGRDSRATCTVVLVGSASAKKRMRMSWCLKYSSMSVT
jgi:hypothetical protein